VIEPIFNEVSQTLSNALGGNFDYLERLSQRRKDNLDVEDDQDDDEEDEYEDEDEVNQDDQKYYPTSAPIYPSVKRKPEGRSLKSSR
jgi:hypothetical protein